LGPECLKSLFILENDECSCGIDNFRESGADFLKSASHLLVCPPFLAILAPIFKTWYLIFKNLDLIL
jgi:hypothetical protein